MSVVKEAYDSEFFVEQGYSHLRPVSPEYERDVEEASQTFHRLISEQANVDTAFGNKDGKLRHLLFVHLHQDIFRRLMLSQEVGSIVRSVFGSERVYVTHSKISHKEAGQDLPWYPHQDNGYKLVNKVPLRKGLTVGIFLEDADEQNGTLQLFPGSHKSGTLPHIFKKENNEDWSGQIVLEKLPTGIEPTSINARKGDIVIFSLDIIHQSPPNRSHGYRPLLLFEIEPYGGFPTDEHGNAPVLLNGSLSRSERLMCSVYGVPKKIKVRLGSVPALKKWYRKVKYR
jgi:ectoine hydroxylase-related dioxygenase (phytanoyl-CoA dioxygenase family)